jgi:hypothetical protein
MRLRKESGRPIVDYVQEFHDLFQGPGHTRGAFSAPGLFGIRLPNLLTIEGDYQFHTKATYGIECRGSREIVWSMHAEVGIDGGRTQVESTLIDTLSNGRRHVRVRFTPRDKYGNYLGPGKADRISVSAGPGGTLIDGLVDNTDGSYTVVMESGSDDGKTSSIVVSQPGRSPVVIPVSKEGTGITLDRYPWTVVLLALLALIVIGSLFKWPMFRTGSRP